MTLAVAGHTVCQRMHNKKPVYQYKAKAFQVLALKIRTSQMLESTLQIFDADANEYWSPPILAHLHTCSIKT